MYNIFMKKVFIERTKIQQNQVVIDGKEFEHLCVVTRAKINEQIIAFCGDEFEYVCVLRKIDKKSALADIIEKRTCTANPTAQITIFQGLAKGEKMEIITQKATELGATELQPFSSKFTIAKNGALRQERLQKISEEACKQCGRSKPMQIFEPQPLEKLCQTFANFDLVLLPYEQAPLCATLQNFVPQILSAQKIAIIIGAEGGFAQDECDALQQCGAHPITLGARILRTETASIALCGFISLIKNN